MFPLHIHFIRQEEFLWTSSWMDKNAIWHNKTNRIDWKQIFDMQIESSGERDIWLRILDFSGFYFVTTKKYIAFDFSKQNLKFMQQINKNNMPVWVAYARFFRFFMIFLFQKYFFSFLSRYGEDTTDSLIVFERLKLWQRSLKWNLKRINWLFYYTN